MAALWDVSTGTFFPDQDWAHHPEDDGSKKSCWDAEVEQEAGICLQGLQNMHSHYASRLAQDPESSVPWGASYHFRMQVMTEWCRRVVAGNMPHGALLAHTRLSGQVVTQEVGYSVPGPGVDWHQHGRDGVAALRAILLSVGFYPRMVESVRDRAPPAVATQADRNRAKKESSFAAVHWQQLNIIRGVELWMDDGVILNDYSWEVVNGGPTVTEVQCPVRSGELMPGELRITYYQQVKGHWFWAMYRDESTGSLTVKWVRGCCPPGQQRWQQQR